MECKFCWNYDIMCYEFMGAYDGILTYKCDSCNKEVHIATGYEVINKVQWENYWNMYFLLRDWDKIKKYVNQYLYRPTLSQDKIFDKLLEDVTI